MGREPPWGLCVSWMLLKETKPLQKCLFPATVEAPVPGKETAVETPPKNELLQLAHGGREADLVSFSSHPGHTCNVSSFMKKKILEEKLNSWLFR